MEKQAYIKKKKYMKHLKLYEDYFDDQFIPKKTIDGIYYHGSIIQDGEFFDNLSFGYSDWNALWFSDEFEISDKFSENWKSDNDDIQVIFKVKLKSKDIADISYEMSQEIMEYYGVEDFRECIPYLENDGYEGWETKGSIGYHEYEDIAIFERNAHNIIEIISMSFKNNNEWSDFIPINQAEEYFDKNFK